MTTTAKNHGDFRKAWREAKKQMRLASEHPEPKVSAMQQAAIDARQREEDNFKSDTAEGTAADLVEEWSRDGWRRDKIAAELTRRGLPIPEDHE